MLINDTELWLMFVFYRVVTHNGGDSTPDPVDRLIIQSMSALSINAQNQHRVEEPQEQAPPPPRYQVGSHFTPLPFHR